jgi:hypothetical protein
MLPWRIPHQFASAQHICSNLPQRAVPILATVDSYNTLLCLTFIGECNINSEALQIIVIVVIVYGARSTLSRTLVDHDLEDPSVLPKVLVSSQGRQQFILTDTRIQSSNVYQIALYHTEAGQMLAVECLDLSFLGFMLPLFVRGSFLLVLFSLEPI